MFWKGESENERNENGLGWCLALSSVRRVYERISVLERELGSISTKQVWFQREMNRSAGVECRNGNEWYEGMKGNEDPSI